MKFINTHGAINQVVSTNMVGEFIQVHNNQEVVKPLLDEYQRNITKAKTMLQKLAKMELQILQLSQFHSPIVPKFFSVGKYLYARHTFTRTEYNKNEIRVLVGTIEEFGGTLEKASKNAKAKKVAIEKLKNTMEELIAA